MIRVDSSTWEGCVSNVIEGYFGPKKQQKMRAAQYVRDFEKTRPLSYEQKFASFFELCDNSKSGGYDAVLIAFPEVLGDTYDELVSNLWHASKAGLLVAIAGHSQKCT